MDELILPNSLYEKMINHVRLNDPEEACGLMAGQESCIQIVIPITNQLHSPVKYFMEPMELYEALQKIDAEGKVLLGIFHSHPKGPAHPSETDINEFLYPGVATIICYHESNRWKVKAFLIEKNQFEEIKLKIV